MVAKVKILDLTAGHRAIWIDKKHPMATYLDIRPEMHPDFICDTRSIPEEVGTGFNLVVYDPPHANFGAKNKWSERYGHFTHFQILDSIKQSGAEAHRVSAANALMAFKWSERSIKLSKVLNLLSTHWEPLFGDVSKYLNKRSQTHWVMLRRLD